jgi:hypothetical protein
MRCRSSSHGAATPLASLALGAALAVGGCHRFEPECGDAPTEAIMGFVVTTETGDNSTNANIYFCYQLESAGTANCTLLDDPLADDFSPSEVNQFEVNTTSPIAVGDLEGFSLQNRGGGFLDNDWELVGLRVEAVLASGSTVLLLSASDVSETLDEGDALDSSHCRY